MRVIRPSEEEEEQEQRQGGQGSNGFEETFCSTKLRTNLDNPREADVYSRQAGRLNIANQHKLPILRFLDLSAEKGNLYPNALITPHWSMNGHSVIYVTRGEAQVQIVSHNGQTLLNLDNPREADVYSRQAGRLNIANQHKLPILRFLDLSAEKGNLYPNALITPHWSMNGHSVIYVTRGEAQVQIVSHNGQTLLNEKVSQGNMFVVPQFF
ncbi:hypothetical protein N619_00010, partial [Ectopseudomonas oleovorans]